MAKGKLVLRQNICKACGLCASVCPKDCLAIDQKTVNVKGYHPIALVNEDACIGCAFCAKMCPDCVIKVEK